MSARKKTAWRTHHTVGVHGDVVSRDVWDVVVSVDGHAYERYRVASYTSRPRAVRHAARLRAALRLEAP